MLINRIFLAESVRRRFAERLVPQVVERLMYRLVRLCQSSLRVVLAPPWRFISIQIRLLLLARHKRYRFVSIDSTRRSAVAMRGVSVCGGLDAFIENGNVKTFEKMDVVNDRLAEEYKGLVVSQKKLFFAPANNRWAEYALNTGSCLSLCGGTSANYAHWLSQYLPRLYFFLESHGSQTQHLNVLVDDEVSEAHLKSIELLVLQYPDRVNELSIFILCNGMLVKCSKLISIFNVGYCQFEPRSSQSPFFLRLDCKLIRSMATRILEGTAPNVCAEKKIFLKRSSEVRRLVNQAEVEELLIANGFDVIVPELLSLSEQVSLFSEATHVIASTGAGLANCIFCQDKTRVSILISECSEHRYEYWTQFLDSDRLLIEYIQGSAVQNVHDSFYVNIDTLESMFLGLS
jgi:hypothetical protein